MKLMFVLAMALATLPARAPSADEQGGLTGAELTAYVDSVIEAYGGEKKLAKLARYRVEGAVVAHVRGGNAVMRRDFAAPDSLRVDLTYADGGEVRILAGAKAWRGDSAAQAAVEGMPHTAMVYQMLRASAPWFIRAHRDRLVHRADAELEGRAHRVLRLVWSDALAVDFWIDDQTRLVSKVEGALAAGRATMTFATAYGDFERVRGVLVPHTEKSYVNGSLTGTATISKVVIGAKKLGPFAPGKR